MQKRILVCALNWGLGHAARSIPVIRSLQDAGAKVLLASDGRAASLWKREFPHLPLLHLPGYEIKYPSANLAWHLGRQLPKLAIAINKEHRACEQLAAKHNIHGIISDHRYGCYVKGIPSAFICHQMQILGPNSVLSSLINLPHRKFLKKFDFHWVPDYPEAPGLAGILSHSYTTAQLSFIGPLSRMKPENQQEERDYLVILSGPEPQRSWLEEKIRRQAKNIDAKWLIVGGKTEEAGQMKLGPNIDYRNFLISQDLEKAINSSRVVICRAGYSSIMDLDALGKAALLIPTPGQPEQEYLAELHAQTGRFAVSTQDALQLENDLKTIPDAPAEGKTQTPQKLNTAIQDFLNRCA
ncbi:MAG: glycosyltransferase [Bacteroidetes bacterium]|nr:glycosyltransferase [Bacteroidota bacterium]